MGYLMAFILGLLTPIVLALYLFHSAEVRMGIVGEDVLHLSSLPYRKWWYKFCQRFKR